MVDQLTILLSFLLTLILCYLMFISDNIIDIKRKMR